MKKRPRTFGVIIIRHVKAGVQRYSDGASLGGGHVFAEPLYGVRVCEDDIVPDAEWV